MCLNLFLTYESLLEKCALITSKMDRNSYISNVYIYLDIFKKPIEKFKIKFKIKCRTIEIISAK